MGKSDKSKKITAFIEEQVFDRSEVYISFPDYICNTEDKIYRCLLDYSNNLNKRGNGWHTPLGIFITIVIIFPISTFKTTFGVPPEIWFAIFKIVGGIAFVWFIISYFKTILSKKIDIEDIIIQLKAKKE